MLRALTGRCRSSFGAGQFAKSVRGRATSQNLPVVCHRFRHKKRPRFREARPLLSASRLILIVDSQSNFKRDLPVRDLAVLDLPAGADDFEPV